VSASYQLQVGKTSPRPKYSESAAVGSPIKSAAFANSQGKLPATSVERLRWCLQAHYTPDVAHPSFQLTFPACKRLQASPPYPLHPLATADRFLLRERRREDLLVNLNVGQRHPLLEDVREQAPLLLELLKPGRKDEASCYLQLDQGWIAHARRVMGVKACEESGL
jgi:hypothetical protein